MTNYIDNTTRIECGECNVNAIGLDAMISHLIDFHPNYSPAEAVQYANAWLSTAYERIEVEDAEFAVRQQQERGLHEWERSRDEGRA